MADLIHRPTYSAEFPADAGRGRARWDAGSTGGGLPPSEPSLLQEYGIAIWRRRWFMLSCALGGLFLGYLATLPQAPVYRARTSLDVQDLNENFLNMRAVDPTGMPAGSSAESYLQTQIKLLQSETVVKRAVQEMGKAPGPESVGPQDAFSQWRASYGWPTPQVPRRELIAQTANGVKVKPLGVTRLIEVTCDGPDAKMAAGFCNMLTSEFIQRSFEVRLDNARQTSEWLGTQMADVRAKLERDEQKLQGYAQVSALFLNQERESISQERLRQVQAELSRAHADRIGKQAQFEMGQDRRDDVDSLPMVLDSGPLKEYQLKLADLRRQYAELSAMLTPEHPKVRRVQAEMTELESTVKRERANVLGRVKNEYDAAQHREQLLATAYAAQEHVVSDQTARAAQFHMLKREVDTGRALYETLLQRGKEAGLAAAMRTNTVRVVDPAQVPKVPLSPRPLSSAAIGLVMGSLLGAAGALVRQRSDRRLRVAGDSALYMDVRELGVVPSARIDNTGSMVLPWRRHGSPMLIETQVDEAGEVRPVSSRLELAAWSSRPSLVAESYRMIMSSLLFTGEHGAIPKVLVVSSPGVHEGKTTLVSNLGIALAETKRKVVLIDGDLRQPRLHDIFGLENEEGLRAVLRGDVDAAEAPLENLVNTTFVPGLSVITSGRSTAEPVASLLHSPHLPKLLARLRNEFDVVLIDSPPMLQLADARLLGHLSDGVVLVLRAGVTTRDTADEARRFFTADGTRVIGTVLNDVQAPANSQRYRSYYAYLQRAAADA